MATKKYLRNIICFVLVSLSESYIKPKSICHLWLRYDFISYLLLLKLYKSSNTEFISEISSEIFSAGKKELLNGMKGLFGKELQVYKTVICNV